MYSMEADAICFDTPEGDEESFSAPTGNAGEYLEKYEHPIWQKYKKDGIVGYHQGIDGLVVSAFIDAVINKTPMPIDVYDTATWMVISVLSEKSILKGGAPVEFPDFTQGKWINRKYAATGFYALN